MKPAPPSLLIRNAVRLCRVDVLCSALRLSIVKGRAGL